MHSLHVLAADCEDGDRMSTYTPGPWIGFTDQKKVVAIMPAGREGDICTFGQSPSDADARLMIAAPAMARALAFYADPRRYEGANIRPIENDPYAKPNQVYIQDVTRDLGEIARAALRGAIG